MSNDLSEAGAWRKRLAQTEEGRDRSCMISPKGEWYNVEFGEHVAFAIAVLRENTISNH